MHVNSGCILNEVGAEESLCSHASQLHYAFDIEPHLPYFLPFVVVIVSSKKKKKKKKRSVSRRRFSKEFHLNQSDIGRSVYENNECLSLKEE